MAVDEREGSEVGSSFGGGGNGIGNGMGECFVCEMDTVFNEVSLIICSSTMSSMSSQNRKDYRLLACLL